jgi:hypothetical protein
VSDVSVLDSVIDYVPGIDIVILPNTLYANDEGSVRAVCVRACVVCLTNAAFCMYQVCMR